MHQLTLPPMWRRVWAARTIQQHRKVYFYLYLTYDIFNPRHNGGSGKWHRISDARYGPLGPEKPSDVGLWAHESMVTTHGNYGHDVAINVVSWRYEQSNDSSVLAFARPMDEVPLMSGRPLKYQFLQYASGVAPSAFETSEARLLRADTDECVVAALVQLLLHPYGKSIPVKKIPHSWVDGDLVSFKHQHASRHPDRPPPAKRVSVESITALLQSIRSKSLFLESNHDDKGGFSIKVIKQACHIFQMNMVALDKHDRVLDSIAEYDSKNNNRPTLAFYAFNGHIYLLATKDAVLGAIAKARESRKPIHLETARAHLQLEREAQHAQDGVFTVYDGVDVPFHVSTALPGGVHLVSNCIDLRRHIFRLMNEEAIEPRINNSTQGGITSFSIKNTDGEEVRVVADPHPGERVDHETLRAIAAGLDIKYSPDAAMGKMVVQILARLGAKRTRFKAGEKDDIVARQGGHCACCGVELEQVGGKWAVEFDHVVALADGGLDTLDNLQALTIPCHNAKTEGENARGYFKKATHASQFNGHIFDTVIKPKKGESQNFDAVQYVEARWLHHGARVQLVDHLYWKDDTWATVECAHDGSLTAIVADEGSEPHDTLGSYDISFVKRKASLAQMRWTIDTLLDAPKCPPAFRARAEVAGEEFQTYKVDVNRCRRNAMYYCEYEWPVFCAMDEIVAFDGEVRCGFYFVSPGTDWRVDLERGGPLDRAPYEGWYGEALVRYCLHFSYISLGDIQFMLIPSQTLPPDHFRKHIDVLEKTFEGHPALQKLAVNTFVGLLGRRSGETRFSYLTKSKAEAGGRFFDNSTGFECHVSKFGTLRDGGEIWQAEYVRHRSEEGTAYPIYKQVLEMGEYIELDRIRRMVELEASGFALEYATDAVHYIVPLPDPNWVPVQTAAGETYYCNHATNQARWESPVPPHVLNANRPGLVITEDAEGNERYSGQINLPHFYWDDEQTRPRYKWEPPKDLRMTHRMKMELCFYPSVEPTAWKQVVTDGPDLAPAGDWTSVAQAVLDLPAVNIDGPPGTGKTSLTRSLIKLIKERHGESGYLALAPTHVAARNLGDDAARIRTIESFKREWQRAHETGGKPMKKLLGMLVKVRYLIVDEISMMHSWLYGLFHAVRRAFPALRLVLVGDFKQLLPVLDVWSGDYKASTALHHLCDGNRLHLTHCRRSDRTLFDLYMAADDVPPALFPVTELTWLHVAYTHRTRIAVNAECMRAFAPAGAVLVPRQPLDPRSQDMALFVTMPLVCHKTKLVKGKVAFANSEIWIVTGFGDDTVQLQRKVEEVDREAGKAREDMPTAEVPLADVQERFRPGFCITLHMSQGKTFRERYTIHDWLCWVMFGRGRYVALSRGRTTGQIQIAQAGGDGMDWDGEEEWGGSDWDGEEGESDWDGE